MDIKTRATKFINEYARPIEKEQFNYLFNGAKKDDYIDESSC